MPEWGGSVLVRGLSGAERDAYETGLMTPQPNGSVRSNLVNVRARLVAMACVDAEGNRLFGDADVAALGDKSVVALDRVFSVARSMSGLSDDDVEDLAEGFGQAPNEVSASV